MDLTIILTGIGTVLGTLFVNVILVQWIRDDLKEFKNEMRKKEVK